MSVNFESFSWEAFATLATGFAAVSAASVVAWRQIAISRAQTLIQSHLADIESLKLRAALFEKRWEVYEATARFLAAMTVKARFPEDGAITHDFQLAMDKSQFLFREAVHGRLVKLWGQACDFGLAVDEVSAVGAEARPDRPRFIRQKSDLMIEFAGLMANLGQVFGDELRLGG